VSNTPDPSPIATMQAGVALLTAAHEAVENRITVDEFERAVSGIIDDLWPDQPGYALWAIAQAGLGVADLYADACGLEPEDILRELGARLAAAVPGGE